MSDGGALAYEPLGGELHRHGSQTPHAHPHAGPHSHEHHHPRPHDHRTRRGGHGHSHGLVERSIVRSRKGLRAVGLSLAVLGLAALAQTIIFIASGSIALLADLIHNFGDAATAIPLGAAFLLRSERAERYAGLFVVAAIFISACVAGVEAVSRLIHPQSPTHLLALAGAGLIGYSGNWVAAQIRIRAGRTLDSAAQIAMIKRECVDEERWTSEESFKKLVAVYQVLPGPEAHELCVYFGRLRGGTLGGFLAGLGFMLPGFILMLGLSVLYVEANLATHLDQLFYGLTAAVGALVARALVRLSGSFLTDLPLTLLAIAGFALT